jgi:predicted transcriptional regulator
MSLTSVTFDIPEDSLATLDEIAENLGENREHVLREAIAFYLEDYKQECAEFAEAERQIDAGETISHEEMLKRFEAMKASRPEKQAA